ncbi:hypothetical protein NQ317_014341 [Molorchus minor]|uniref:Uncharacterized protein n=1 Tax=Molorchus minor TaxID=1323400 RepID=A0ABQ9K6N3_9CUCU|nr:hypothetical protein NQ317_014341 [Molorchus minor]
MTTGEENVTREDIPLKQGKKSSSWYNYCNEDCLSGSKFLNVAFGTLTIVITIALLVQIYYGDYQVILGCPSWKCGHRQSRVFKHRHISIEKGGGNAVDAAIASAFCLAVATPHVTSLDAEGQLLIYNHRTRLLPTVIDFSGPTVVSDNIPRLVLGLAYTHQHYGRLAWKDLVQPAANLARQGYLISKVLVQAVTKAKAQNLYGHLEAGQMITHKNLSLTLEGIANIPEPELYRFIQSTNQPILSQALKSTFNNNNIYLPNTPAIGRIVMTNLREIEGFNYTIADTAKAEYYYELARITQAVYQEQNVSELFHQGTLSNVGVMDLDDNYVSLVTKKDKPCSRMPIIITDNNVICGRRMVFGASDLATATQLVTSLLVARKNTTDGVEAPRFYIIDNGTLAIEDSHLPAFDDDVLPYFQNLTRKPVRAPEPYPSSNIVEKIKDDLSSHSDSRGGGIASRF